MKKCPDDRTTWYESDTWCSAKLPCGRCISVDKHATKKEAEVCGYVTTPFNPPCEECQYKFRCFTNKAHHQSILEQDYKPLNSFIGRETR